MKILALGGGGFIGSHTIDWLLRHTDHEVVAYDLYDDKITDFLDHSRLTYIHGDIRKDHKRLEKLIEESDVVVDLIAYANPSLYVTMPLEVFHLNFTENLVIAEACVRHRKRLVQFSTCEVYGKTVVSLAGDKLKDPKNPAYGTFEEDTSPMILGSVSQHRWIYACAKSMLERILHAYGLDNQLEYSIIRPFNFIGPKIDYLPSEQDGNPRVFSHFVESLKTGKPMKLVNGGEQQRSYTHIDDAVDCIVRIIIDEKKVCDKHIFNIGNPRNELTIREMALKMREIYERRWWDGVHDLPELESISGEAFYGKGYDDSDRRIPDITKARTLLGWEPKHDLEATLELSMSYWFEQDVSETQRAAARKSLVNRREHVK